MVLAIGSWEVRPLGSEGIGRPTALNKLRRGAALCGRRPLSTVNDHDVTTAPFRLKQPSYKSGSAPSVCCSFRKRKGYVLAGQAHRPNGDTKVKRAIAVCPTQVLWQAVSRDLPTAMRVNASPLRRGKPHRFPCVLAALYHGNLLSGNSSLVLKIGAVIWLLVHRTNTDNILARSLCTNYYVHSGDTWLS